MNKFSLDDFRNGFVRDIAAALQVFSEAIHNLFENIENMPDSYYDNPPVFPPANAPNSYLNGLALHLKNPHKQRDWHTKYMREYYRRQK